MTTIHEGLKKTQERAAAEKKIAERYPGAKLEVLPGQTEAWTSGEIANDASEIFLLNQSSTMVALYVEVDGVPVFHPAYRGLIQVLNHFRDTDPYGYQRLLKSFVEFIR